MLSTQKCEARIRITLLALGFGRRGLHISVRPNPIACPRLAYAIPDS